jgi:hypothetical protein
MQYGPRSIKDIPQVRRYFGTGAAIVAQEFSPGKGWISRRYRKRVSFSWLRKLRNEGVTHVALSADGRVADFGVDELLRTPREPGIG